MNWQIGILGDHRKRARVAVAVVGVAVVAALLVGYLVTRSPASQRFAFYDAGHVTLRIDDRRSVVLPLLDEGATLSTPTGASLVWLDTNGWYLNINGPFGFDPRAAPTGPTPAPAGSDRPIVANGSLQLEGVDFRRWAGFDSNACVIVYMDVTTTRIAGSIRCIGLLWYDHSSVEHVEPVEAPPFDLDVDFEATGTGTLPGSSPS